MDFTLLVVALLASMTLIGINSYATSLIPLEDTDWLSSPVSIVTGELVSNPQMAVEDDQVYIVWVTSQGVMFSKSSDDGKTFSTPSNLAGYPNSSSVSLEPQIMASNDNVYVLYSSGRDILLLSSHDRGKTFSGPVNVSRTDPSIQPLVVANQVMSSFDKGVYVAWTTVVGSWAEIFFAQSSDGGISFGDPVNVSNNEDGSSLPRISSYGNHVYLAWQDIGATENDFLLYHVSFASSDDGGQSFHSTYNLSNNTGTYYSLEHQISAGSDDLVYVAWRNEVPDGSEVVIAKSLDSGKSFQDPIVLGAGARPQISVQGDNVYVAWTALDDRITFSRSTDWGASFAKANVVSENAVRASAYDDMPTPSLAGEGKNVYIAWRSVLANRTTEDANHNTFLVASYDGGQTFSRELNLGKRDGADSWHPNVLGAAVDRIFVLWQDTETDRADAIDIRLVAGRIPEVYTEPYREISHMTPFQPYNPTIPIITLGAALTAAAGVGFYYLRNKRSKQ